MSVAVGDDDVTAAAKTSISGLSVLLLLSDETLLRGWLMLESPAIGGEGKRVVNGDVCGGGGGGSDENGPDPLAVASFVDVVVRRLELMKC